MPSADVTPTSAKPYAHAKRVHGQLRSLRPELRRQCSVVCHPGTRSIFERRNWV
jgi:hypothetical protein